MSVNYFRNPFANIHLFLIITTFFKKNFTELFIIREFLVNSA